MSERSYDGSVPRMYKVRAEDSASNVSSVSNRDSKFAITLSCKATLFHEDCKLTFVILLYSNANVLYIMPASLIV